MIAKKALEGNSHISFGTEPRKPPKTSEMSLRPFKAAIDMTNMQEYSMDGRSGPTGASTDLETPSTHQVSSPISQM